MQTPTLHTARLRLEPIGLHHAADLQPRFHDPEVQRHLSASIPDPYPDDGMHWFLEHILLPAVRAERAMGWALVLKATGTAVGVLTWRRAASAEGDRGFWLARAQWGQGLMTEALEAFQDFVFFDVGIARLELRSSIDNHASARLKEKMGCVKLGEADADLREGDRVDVWELTRDRWAALRGR